MCCRAARPQHGDSGVGRPASGGQGHRWSGPVRRHGPCVGALGAGLDTPPQVEQGRRATVPCSECPGSGATGWRAPWAWMCVCGSMCTQWPVQTTHSPFGRLPGGPGLLCVRGHGLLWGRGQAAFPEAACRQRKAGRGEILGSCCESEDGSFSSEDRLPGPSPGSGPVLTRPEPGTQVPLRAGAARGAPLCQPRCVPAGTLSAEPTLRPGCRGCPL